MERLTLKINFDRKLELKTLKIKNLKGSKFFKISI